MVKLSPAYPFLNFFKNFPGFFLCLQVEDDYPSLRFKVNKRRFLGINKQFDGTQFCCSEMAL
jgi:hypothetical protein